MTNIKLKLIAPITTIALFALPIAEAAAHSNWGLRKDALTIFQLVLVGLFTAGALFALPIAEAAASNPPVRVAGASGRRRDTIRRSHRAKQGENDTSPNIKRKLFEWLTLIAFWAETSPIASATRRAW